MSSTITDREVLAFIAKTEAAYPPDAVDLSVAEQRRIYEEMTVSFRQPRPAGLTVRDSTLKGPAGTIPVRSYGTESTASARVVYFHGGGFIVGGLDSHDDVCAEIATVCGVEVVSVDYRLCPEHPHPAAYDDALAAVDALSGGSLILMGDSAGANLAAAVALSRRAAVRAQVLIYPGLGGEALGLPSYTERAEAPLLTTRDIHYYKTVRAGGRDTGRDWTFAPLLADDLSDAPECFVSAAEHDPLRDDGPDYVRRLRAAGITAQCIVEPELPHGHLRARHSTTRAREAFDRVLAAISGIAR